MGNSDLYRKVTASLWKNHFERIAGGKGSHEKWENTVLGVTLTVPRNLKSKHTANNILKDAGLPKMF